MQQKSSSTGTESKEGGAMTKEQQLANHDKQREPLAELSEEALAQAVMQRLQELTELRAMLAAQEKAMAAVRHAISCSCVVLFFLFLTRVV